MAVIVKPENDEGTAPKRSKRSCLLGGARESLSFISQERVSHEGINYWWRRFHRIASR